MDKNSMKHEKGCRKKASGKPLNNKIYLNK